jgi:hypothetical protein
MRFYRRLSLYRRVQVIAVGMLLLYQIGGFTIALAVGASRDEIMIGLGIEMIGAVFTAMVVAYIDKSFTMAFDKKYGDPLQTELAEIRQAITQLQTQLDQEIATQHLQSETQMKIDEQLASIQKQQALLTTFIRHTNLSRHTSRKK